MLQRAASNAYSWWWASRIRTSQSKWLDGNLEEMDERVKIILKLLGEEADSFAKRAEMYYKRRPEVISNVEEAYRAYRALAERYDHVSGELHKANHTIATAFPEQVQYAMLEDDEADDSEHVPKAITPIDPSKIRKSTVEGLLKKRKKEKEKDKKRAKSDQSKIPKEKAQEEINQLQKAILVLQTEKEFIKSSYETGIAKYWEIEKQMAEMQEEVIMLQEESGETGTVFDDSDARALMTATAMKSCEAAILKLLQIKKESAELARVQSERIQVAIARFRSIKGEAEVADKSQNQSQPLTDFDNDDVEVNQVQREQLEVILEKVKKHFEMNPDSSAEEIAGKIDEVVGKVIDLEMKVSSQTAQIGRLSEENGELERNLEELEKEKMGLINDSNEFNKRLREVEEELKRAKESEKAVKQEETDFNSEFKDVVSSLSSISKKFERVEVRENVEGSEEVDYSELIISENIVMKDEAEMAGQNDSFEETNQIENVELSKEGKNEDLITSEKIPLKNDSELIGQKDSSEENDLEGNVELSSKEGDYNDLINSESIILTSEAEISGEKVSSEQKDQNSEFGLTSGPAEVIPVVSSVEEIKETDTKIDEKESKENFNLISVHGSDEPEINEEKEEREIESSSHKKQKGSILSEIMETDSPKLEKNKKTYKRGISLQQGEREYAPLTERIPNFRGAEREGVLSWQELLLDGLEGRDSILLAEYTSILRNYKETKRRLNELEKRNHDQFSETSRVVRELRKDNALKDEEIRVLKQLVGSLKMKSEGNNVILDGIIEEEENLEREREAQVEEKLKGDIDLILDENFKFMLRLSASLNRIPDFESKFKDLQSEFENSSSEEEKGKEKVEEIRAENPNPKPETTEKKLRDLKTEIEVWVEQITMLKQELKTRVSSLNNTQEEISQAVRASSTADGSRLSVYQGEVLSMQQETDKAEQELKAGLDLVSGIRLKIDSDLCKIRESFELPKIESESRWNSFQQYPSKNRVPLRNFLFGPKPKKKNKFFAILNPIIQRHLRDIKGGHFGK